jgi:hypothetical protein
MRLAWGNNYERTGSLRFSGSQEMYALIVLSGVSLFLFFLALSGDPNLPRHD